MYLASLVVCFCGIAVINAAIIGVPDFMDTHTADPLPIVPECQDKLNNCIHYSVEQCVGRNVQWDKANCALRCGYCPGQTQPCEDRYKFCSTYGYLCTDHTYSQWASENCRKYCNKCDCKTVVNFLEKK